MAINIGGYNFDGPYGHTKDIENASGVYAILGRSGTSPWSIVDVGESGALRDRIDTHDRSPCWRRRGHAQLAAAVLYVPERQRMAIEQQLRGQLNPPCGEQ
jgi:hypothetical protein